MPSEKILKEKEQAVAELTQKLKDSNVGVFVDYRGINVAQDTLLRRDLREAGVEYTVIKNSIMRFAVKDAGIEGLDDVLKGTTALAVSKGDKGDYTSAAKILTTFARRNDFFKIKAGFVDSGAIDETGVRNLASLPPKEMLVAQVLGVMNAPIRGLATVLNENISGLARTLNAIAEQKSA